jgi:hypothetical protein
MVDGKPLPENLASEHEGAAEDSPAPNEALTGESAGAARPTQASPPDETAAPTPPTDLKPGYVVAGAIGMMGFLSSLIWLISFPPRSRRRHGGACRAVSFMRCRSSHCLVAILETMEEGPARAGCGRCNHGSVTWASADPSR